jgi:hypothetical protein
MILRVEFFVRKSLFWDVRRARSVVLRLRLVLVDGLLGVGRERLGGLLRRGIGLGWMFV